MHVGFAGECDDLGRSWGRVGRDEVSERPGGDEALLEADAPLERIHLKGAERAAAEGLTVHVLLQHAEGVCAKTIPDLGLGADVIAEDRHVADAGTGLGPVFRYNIFLLGLVVEKIVDRAGDEQIYVEVEDGADEVIKRLLEKEHAPEALEPEGLG